MQPGFLEKKSYIALKKNSSIAEIASLPPKSGEVSVPKQHNYSSPYQVM